MASLFIASSFLKQFSKIWQQASAASLIVGGIGVIFMTNSGNNFVNNYYPMGLNLVLLSIFTLMKIRFVVAVPSGLLLIALFAATYNFSLKMLVSHLFFLGSMNLLGLAACYQLERITRLEFLKNRLLNQEKEHTETVNQELELRVEERTADINAAKMRLEKEVIEKTLLAQKNDDLQKKLLQAERLEAVGRLAGGIAHDFNNLLTVISGYSELAKESPDDSELITECVTEILETSRRASNLTRQLLTFSRRQNIKPSIVQPDELINSLQKLLKRLLSEDIGLLLQLNSKGTIFVDPGQFEQIIVNLVVNAADAIGDRGTITIETQDIKNELVLLISDNGTGMTKETMDKIFDPFFSTKSPGSGTGLGLSTVFGIVKSINGQIEVISETGKGSTFKIVIPTTFEKPNTNSQKATGRMCLNNLKVLLIEDNDQVRAVASKMLQNLGCVVLATSSGLEAIATVNDTIELIISDVVMPGMSGPEVAIEIKKKYPNLPVLFTSGYTPDKILNFGISSDFQYLLKPYTNNELFNSIKTLILN